MGNSAKSGEHICRLPDPADYANGMVAKCKDCGNVWTRNRRYDSDAHEQAAEYAGKHKPWKLRKKNSIRAFLNEIKPSKPSSLIDVNAVFEWGCLGILIFGLLGLVAVLVFAIVGFVITLGT